MSFEILSTGKYIPKNKVTNFDLEKNLDVNDEWIFARTGIKSRYHASKDETTEDFAFNAAKEAILKSDIDKNDIEAVIVATFTPEYITPSVACMVQDRLGLKEDIIAFDVNAACSGFVYGLKIADSLFSSMENGKCILVIGAEIISKVLDLSDVGTAILFGDGAGAALLRKKDDKTTFFTTGSRGSKEEIGCIGINNKNLDSKVYMNGKDVFRFATSTVMDCIKKVMKETHTREEDIDFVICHQANQRIITGAQEKLKFPPKKFYSNIANYGNTSSASIGIVLDEMVSKNMLKKGMKIIMVGFGAGLAWGATLIEW